MPKHYKMKFLCHSRCRLPNNAVTNFTLSKTQYFLGIWTEKIVGFRYHPTNFECTQQIKFLRHASREFLRRDGFVDSSCISSGTIFNFGLSETVPMSINSILSKFIFCNAFMKSPPLRPTHRVNFTYRPQFREFVGNRSRQSRKNSVGSLTNGR